MSPRKLKTDPQILQMQNQKMAVVYGKGTPQEVFPKLMPALYGSVYTLKFDLKKKGLPTFKVTGLRARYPDAEKVSKDKWSYAIGLPVPDDTVVLPQKIADTEVILETWRYGTVAQILHLGAYNQENSTIMRLMEFIKDSGYKISGDHEEEYLAAPDAKVAKTLIRYQVSKST